MVLPRRRVDATLLLALALAPTLVPREARAWCLFGDRPTAYADYWRARFPDLRIPVYISLGPESDLRQTGLGPEQAEVVVRRVIATHNETVATPTLFYAGTTRADLDPQGGLDGRPPGIVLDSFGCALLLGPRPPCLLGQVACTAVDAGARARVTLRSNAHCGDLKEQFGRSWGLDASYGLDVSRVLLHEFGHALGLDHTDQVCPGLGDGAPAVGVMATTLGSASTYERDWRRDDLEGLRQIYGDELRHTVYTWSDDRFPAHPVESRRQALCAGPRTPPALGVGPDEALFIAFTDADDRVAHLEWDGERFVAPAGGAVVDPSPLGVSFAPVGLAQSDDRLLIVWAADDGKFTRGVRLRWALRDLPVGAWSFGELLTPDGETQRSSDVSVGHDPAHDLFVVGSINGQAHPYFVALDPDGAQLATRMFGQGVLSPPFVYDLGALACVGDTCVVPFTAAEYAPGFGPAPYLPMLEAGWYTVEVADDGALTMLTDTRADTLPGGLAGLAAGPGLVRGVAGARRYALASTPADAAPLREPAGFDAGDWPLRLGSHRVDDTRALRVAGRRLGPRCGDGTLDCDEGCDDANRIDGDGCSARCTEEIGLPIAPDETTGASDEGSSEATGELEPASDGCDCTSARPPAPLALTLPLLLRRRRRRREHARPIGPRSD